MGSDIIEVYRSQEVHVSGQLIKFRTLAGTRSSKEEIKAKGDQPHQSLEEQQQERWSLGNTYIVMLSDKGQKTGPAGQIKVISAHTQCLDRRFNLEICGKKMTLLIYILSLIRTLYYMLSALDRDEVSMWAVVSPQTEKIGEQAD